MRLKPNAVKTEAILKLRAEVIEYLCVGKDSDIKSGNTVAPNVHSFDVFHDVSDMYNIPSQFS